MFTRFDVLLIVLIVLCVFGFPGGFLGSRVPPQYASGIVIVVLVVLLLLGVVRY